MSTALEAHLTKIQSSVKLPKVMGSSTFPEKQHIFDNRMIKRAITLSQYALNEPDNYRPFGAVIVRDFDRKLLAERVSDTGKTKDPSAHGELLAIRDACKLLGKETLQNCTIYTSCEPCPMCTALIHATQLSRVVYACARSDVTKHFDFSQQLEDIVRPIHERSIPAVSLSGKEAATVINNFYSREEQ